MTSIKNKRLEGIILQIRALLRPDEASRRPDPTIQYGDPGVKELWARLREENEKLRNSNGYNKFIASPTEKRMEHLNQAQESGD